MPSHFARREGVAALEREFAGLAEAASAAGTDDEHDPEGGLARSWP